MTDKDDDDALAYAEACMRWMFEEIARRSGRTADEVEEQIHDDVFLRLVELGIDPGGLQ